MFPWKWSRLGSLPLKRKERAMKRQSRETGSIVDQSRFDTYEKIKLGMIAVTALFVIVMFGNAFCQYVEKQDELNRTMHEKLERARSPKNTTGTY